MGIDPGRSLPNIRWSFGIEFWGDWGGQSVSAGAEAGVDEVVGIEMKAKRLKAGQRREAGGRRSRSRR